MKKIITHFIIFISLFSNLYIPTFAADFGVSASAGTVSPGGTFNISISVPGAGRFSISGSNATVSASSIWCENSCSLSATAGSSGTATVSISASDVTGNDETPVVGSKNVSVAISTPKQTPEPPANIPDNAAENTPVVTNAKVEPSNIPLTLKSLSVEKLSLSPSFSEDITSYTVDVPYGTEKVKVIAEKSHNEATLEGIGEVDITKAEQLLVTVSNNENKKNAYIIKLNKELTPSIKLEGMDKKEYSLITNGSNKMDLKDFKEYKFKIKDKEVFGMKHVKKDIVLVYCLDESGKGSYYIFDEKTNEITSVFKPIMIDGKYCISISMDNEIKKMFGFHYKEISIGETKVDSLEFDDAYFENYVVLYLSDENMNNSLYSYNLKDKTIQKYSYQAPITQEKYEELLKDLNSKKQMFMFSLGGFGVLFIILLVVIMMIIRKQKTKPVQD